MRNETAPAPTGTILPREYTFTTVETQTEITKAIQHLHTTGNAQIALVVIRLGYKSAERKRQFAERACQTSFCLLQNIRPLVRKTDCVFLHQHALYFVLPGANLQGAEIVEERLWEALVWRIHNMRTMNEQETARPISLAIGHSALPDPQSTVDELLHAVGEISKHFSEHPSRRWRREKNSTGKEEPSQVEEKEELPRLARKLGIPYLTPLPRKLPRRLLHTVNARLARELCCYPVGRERNMLTVAMLNPQDHQALERLRQETGLHIFPVLAHPDALDMAIKQLS